MISRVKNKLRSFYLHRIKHLDDSAILVMDLRKRGMTIGEHCRIFTNISSKEPSLIRIGDRVTVSSEVSFCTHDNAVIKAIPGKTDVVGRICIGNDCFIGMRSILMYGVTLGDRCIVGAGSVVTRSFPSGKVIAGNPAKVICSVEDYAEKYRDYAVDFSAVPLAERKVYFETHPEIMVER